MHSFIESTEIVNDSQYFPKIINGGNVYYKSDFVENTNPDCPSQSHHAPEACSGQGKQLSQVQCRHVEYMYMQDATVE